MSDTVADLFAELDTLQVSEVNTILEYGRVFTRLRDLGVHAQDIARHTHKPKRTVYLHIRVYRAYLTGALSKEDVTALTLRKCESVLTGIELGRDLRKTHGVNTLSLMSEAGIRALVRGDNGCPDHTIMFNLTTEQYKLLREALRRNGAAVLTSTKMAGKERALEHLCRAFLETAVDKAA